MILVPAFVAALVYWQAGHAICRPLALGIFSLACLSDAVDGAIARRRRQQTHLGSLLDPLADKILLITAYLGLSLMGNIPASSQIPAWLTLIVVSRDLFLLMGAMMIFVTQNAFYPRTNFLGKVTTVSQMVLIVALLAGCGALLKNLLMMTTASFTLASGATYLSRGAKMLSNGGRT